jgi:thiol:disulfide interchange protein
LFKIKFFLFLVGWLLLGGHNGNAQIDNPVRWSFSSKAAGEGKAELILTANIQPGWHVYSQFLEEGGAIPTSFKFEPSKEYKLLGKVSESPKAKVSYDRNFGVNVAWHENEVQFIQLIELKNTTTVKGTLEFMVCNATKCLQPEELEFSIPVTVNKVSVSTLKPTKTKSDSIAQVPSTSRDTDSVATLTTLSTTPTNVVAAKVSNNHKAAASLWSIFIAGFLGGLLAFFMPCIYPMIPLTVSYFTKKASSRAKGISDAIVYALAIIVIYVALGLLVTVIFGASALNEAASSATFNLIFFVVLILFALSFLGAFDISLPSSLVNKMDEKSNKSGLAGLFFMAFTLALVSFSCTGPIIGTLLVETVSEGAYLGPAIGMLGFSSALAIPFALFAVFPSWLKEMPKSGGWMNAVKVSLGFLELALAFKFLSNVDLAYHWNVLGRDIFLVIWITIFGLWGLYLLGKFKLAHDTEVGFISITRLFFAMLVLGFTIYMIPGLFGAPLKAISAWLPPQATQEFDLYSKTYSSQERKASAVKYTNLFHAPHGLDAFYDYEEGLAYAKKVDKPVLIDFTGWSCTNCRKMEASVWADPGVLSRLKNDYVIISLYVDDKTPLSESERYVSQTGKKVKTLGNKWSDLQTRQFKTNSQPYYVIVNSEGKELVPAQAFNLDIDHYISFLDSGKAAFRENKP